MRVTLFSSWLLVWDVCVLLFSIFYINLCRSHRFKMEWFCVIVKYLLNIYFGGSYVNFFFLVGRWFDVTCHPKTMFFIKHFPSRGKVYLFLQPPSISVLLFKTFIVVVVYNWFYVLDVIVGHFEFVSIKYVVVNVVL